MENILNRTNLASSNANTDVIYTTNSVNFLPLYIFGNNYYSSSYSKLIFKDSFEYYEQKIADVKLKSSDFMYHLTSLGFHKKFDFTYSGEKQHIYVGLGTIRDQDGEYLLSLCVKNDVNIYKNTEELSFNLLFDGHNLNTDLLTMFISEEFFINPKYKSLYRRLEKEYLPLAFRNNVEITITKTEEIRNKIFNNGDIIDINFNSIKSFQKHLNTKVSKFIFSDYLPENIQYSLDFTEHS